VPDPPFHPSRSPQQDIAAVEQARVSSAEQGEAVPEELVRVVTMRPARENATHV
jgi:hypothetical protein